MKHEPTPQQKKVMEKIISPKSNATTANPKDVVGSTKVSLTKLPAIAIAVGAHAMMDGARKYSPYNWRANDVQAGVYVDAAMRHLLDWFEGQENAPDSGVHHLGHVIGCCAILLDAQHRGNLIDDRPIERDGSGQAIKNDMFAQLLDELSKKIKERNENKA